MSSYRNRGKPRGLPNFATCKICGQQMIPGQGCQVQELKIAGTESTRILFISDSEDPCGDCNVASGQTHHGGCDQERCPNCLGQLISCPCEIEIIENHA